MGDRTSVVEGSPLTWQPGRALRRCTPPADALRPGLCVLLSPPVCLCSHGLSRLPVTLLISSYKANTHTHTHTHTHTAQACTHTFRSITVDQWGGWNPESSPRPPPHHPIHHWRAKKGWSLTTFLLIVFQKVNTLSVMTPFSCVCCCFKKIQLYLMYSELDYAAYCASTELNNHL